MRGQGGGLAQGSFNDVGEQVLLGWEVVVQEALADVGFSRDVAGPRCGQAVAGKDASRGG
jgi:hypothetical protein